jgi:hypothetical protein
MKAQESKTLLFGQVPSLKEKRKLIIRQSVPCPRSDAAYCFKERLCLLGWKFRRACATRAAVGFVGL